MNNSLFRLICLGAIGVLTSCSLSAQSFKYRKFNFEWKNKAPAPIPVEEQFKNEDAVILQEDNIFNQYEDYHTKHVRIKLLTEKGAQQFNRFILPEGYDPVGDKMALNIVRRDSIYRPKGEFECIEYFAARIIKPDGAIEEAKIQESTQEELIWVNQVEQHYYNWIFTIANIKPGDEIEAEYAFRIVYNQQPSFKIFFNGILPKQNYTMKFRNRAVDYFMLTYHNGAEPNDSSMDVKGSPNYTEYVFRRKNLVGGITEAGARPYLELPYITYYYHDRSYGTANPRTGFVDYPKAFPWTVMLLEFIKYKKDDLDKYLGAFFKSTVAINKFFKEQIDLAGDTNSIVRFNTIQHTLNTEFGYHVDYHLSETDRNDLPKLGEYVSNRQMREISRDSLYRQLFLRLRTNYFATKVFDKRYYSFDPSRFEIETSYRLFYVLTSGPSIGFYYPKTGHFGFEGNELPFYFENQEVMLIPQLAESHLKKDPFPGIIFPIDKTPTSAAADNTRTSNVAVNVNLDTLQLNFDARLRLSGQFSTLTRGFYLYNEKDTTINRLYFKRLYDIGNNVRVTKSELNSFNKQYPFKAEFALNYLADNRITKTDSGYKINISSFFNHVIEDKFSAQNRHLAFYPDFQGNDVFRYMLKFDKNIEVVNAAELNEMVKNGFGSYMFTVKQNDSTSVLIESNYRIRAEYVPAANTRDVDDIYDKIKKANNSSLIVRAR